MADAASAPFKALLAVDFSKASSLAVQRAIPLAQRLGASIVLVHAFSPPPKAAGLSIGLSAGGYIPYLKAEARLHAKEALELSATWATRLRDAGLDVETDARQGDPGEVVLAAAEEHDVDLLILGRQGMGMVRRFVTGSVTRHVVQHSRRPVVILPID